MKLLLLIFLCMFSVMSLSAQELTGQQLLDKAIEYHDPQGNWLTFHGILQITMLIPDKPQRVSKVEINLPQEYFSVTAKRDTTTTTYSVDRGICSTSVKATHPDNKRTPCETAQLYKNYYTYLYGLPMKLKDPGTFISQQVSRNVFKGKEYLVLKVSYDQAVGKDIWFFYFDPLTYAMEVYQFYKGDPNGAGKNTGEYILLSEEKIVNQIKIPKVRAWYYNKDHTYLGTDLLH